MWISKKEHEAILQRLNALENRGIDEIIKEFDLGLHKEILELREDFERELRNLRLKMNEYDRAVRNDMESGLLGLTKTFDSRLSSLGDKRGIVTDLLKKIASMEDVHS